MGLLLDHQGNDSYSADIFAQGAAYWFGFGMLVDGAGNDRYEAFEHAQGEGLHLAAGLLADWGGDDHYTGNEHVQGVGMDRSAGILFEAAGISRRARLLGPRYNKNRFLYGSLSIAADVSVELARGHR